MKTSKEEAVRILRKNKSKFLKEFMGKEKVRILKEAFKDKDDSEIPDIVKEMLQEANK